jgi:hypothetical protein
MTATSVGSQARILAKGPLNITGAVFRLQPESLNVPNQKIVFGRRNAVNALL